MYSPMSKVGRTYNVAAGFVGGGEVSCNGYRTNEWVLILAFGNGMRPQPALLGLTTFPVEPRLMQEARMVVATVD